jgi:hypothetical protein
MHLFFTVQVFDNYYSMALPYHTSLVLNTVTKEYTQFKIIRIASSFNFAVL